MPQFVHAHSTLWSYRASVFMEFMVMVINVKELKCACEVNILWLIP